MVRLPPEIWRAALRGLGLPDILRSTRVCRAWRRGARRACADRWPHPVPPWAPDAAAAWSRVLDPRPRCMVCRDAERPASVVVVCTCVRRTLRFHPGCWDCRCLRADCSVVLVRCPVCGAARVGWRRFLLE